MWVFFITLWVLWLQIEYQKVRQKTAAVHALATSVQDFPLKYFISKTVLFQVNNESKTLSKCTSREMSRRWRGSYLVLNRCYRSDLAAVRPTQAQSVILLEFGTKTGWKVTKVSDCWTHSWIGWLIFASDKDKRQIDLVDNVGGGKTKHLTAFNWMYF